MEPTRRAFLAAGLLPLVPSHLWAEPPAPGEKAAAPIKLDALGDPLPPGAIMRLGTLRMRHQGPVTAVAFAPDGKTVASSSYDGTARVWEVATGKELRKLSEFGTIYGLVYSGDGKSIITVGPRDHHRMPKQECVRLWDVATGQRVAQLAPDGVFESKCVAVCGTLLATAGWKSIFLWDPATGQLIHRLEGHGDHVVRLSASADGTLLASGGGERDGTVRIWDTSTGRELRKFGGADFRVGSPCLSPDGKTLATTTSRGVRVWRVDSGEEIARFDAFGSPTFSPDSKLLALQAGSSPAIHLYEVATGAFAGHLEGHGLNISAIAFSADGRVIASGSFDNTVRLWDANTRRELLEFPGHKYHVRSVVYSPDGKLIASAGGDYTVRLWDAASGKELKVLQPLWKPGVRHSNQHHAINGIEWSRDSRLIALACDDWHVRVWEPASGALLSYKGQNGPVTCVAFSADGKTLASADRFDGIIRLREMPSGRELKVLDFQQGLVRREDHVLCMTYSPDGKVLAAGSGGGVRFWDSVTAKELKVFAGKGPGSVTFSPDGQTVASASGGYDAAFSVWDAATGQDRWRMPKATDYHMISLAYSPDGKTLASLGQNDRVVRLWNAATGRQIRALPGHAGRQYYGVTDVVSGLAFSPDGMRIASGGLDTTVLIWEVSALAP